MKPSGSGLGEGRRKGGESRLICKKAQPPPISWALRGGDTRAWPITRRLEQRQVEQSLALHLVCSGWCLPTGFLLLDLLEFSSHIQGRNNHLHFADEAAEAQRGQVTCPRSHSQSAAPELSQALSPSPGC